MKKKQGVSPAWGPERKRSPAGFDGRNKPEKTKGAQGKNDWGKKIKQHSIRGGGEVRIRKKVVDLSVTC